MPAEAMSLTYPSSSPAGYFLPSKENSISTIERSILLERLHTYVKPSHPKYQNFLNCIDTIDSVENYSLSFSNNFKYLLRQLPQCEICFKPLSPGNLNQHLRNHESGKINTMNPKMTLYVMPKFDSGARFFCMFDCNQDFKNQTEVKNHLVNCHSYDELKKWGYRRDLLEMMVANINSFKGQPIPRIPKHMQQQM